MWRFAVAAALALAAAAASRRRRGAAVAAAALGGGKPKATAPGITATHVTVGGHFPLTGPGRAGLQRDPAGDRRLLQARQRQRRRPRAQAEDDHPRRRLQPRQHGQGHQAARAAGQGLRDPRRARHADAHQGRRLPQRRARCPTSSCPPAAAAGTSREAPVHVRLAARLHCRGQDPRPATSPRTSRARRSPTSSRTTTSAPTASPGPGHVRPQDQVVTRADLRAGQHRHRAADGQDQGVGRRGRRLVLDPRLHGAAAAGRRQARLPPAAGREQRRRGPDDADRPAEVVLQGRRGRVADRRASSADGYLPPPGDASNSWIALFDKIHDQYIPKLP